MLGYALLRDERAIGLRSGGLAELRAVSGAGLDELDEQAWGGTILHMAAREGMAFIALALVAGGASLDIVNQAGHTPLQGECQLSNSTKRQLRKVQSGDSTYGAGLQRIRREYDLHQRSRCSIQ